jgi:hypothetical protein
MRVDIETAKALRSEGFTYEEIAFRVGCSKAWCAKHLSSVPKGLSDPSKLSNDELKNETLRILEKAISEIRSLK